MTDVFVRAAALDPERAAETPVGIFLTNAGDIKIVSVGDGHAVEVTLSLNAALDFAGLLIDRVAEESRRRVAAAPAAAVVAH